MKYVQFLIALVIGQSSSFQVKTSVRNLPKLKTAKTSPPSRYPTINGWSPDESKFCWGLPGSVEPFPDFDPFGLAKKTSLDETKRYREAEVTHGRVAMLAVLGFLVGERFHPLFGAAKDEILGIYALGYVRQVMPFFFELLAISIGIFELVRATTGWVPPTKRNLQGVKAGNFLNDDYYPGDIGFDPLGLKPSTPAEFSNMATKELQHGRLAMLAVAGFVAQELVNQTPVLKSTFGI